MKSILAAFARNTVFANIILIILFVAGIMAVLSMTRETFPEFSLDMITINVPYPGADPEEVEEGISQKIEEAIEGLEGIKQYTTYSTENMATAIIEVKENYEVDEVLDRVKNKIDAISTLPPDAEKPIVTEMLLRDVVMFLSLSGDMSERQLKEWAETTKDEIRQIPEVSQVELWGVREYQIDIEVSEERLREYGLTFDHVAGAIRASGLNQAGGTIRTEGEDIRVRTMGRKYTGKELAQVVVLAKPSGEIITLDRLAEIKDGFQEDSKTSLVNGEPAAMMIVFKTKEEDSIEISEAVKKFVSDKQQVLPDAAKLTILYDGTEMLHSRINLLVENGLLGLGLVFLLLWIFLDIRLSFWSGMGMPISVAGALSILWAIGATINMISLFGLIMVLGIVVDDAIVVGEAIFMHRQLGKPPLTAAVEGISEVGLPVTAAVLTSIVGFIPLAYIGGIMGKFIAIMPVTVIACLVISLIECLFLMPAHLSHLPAPNNETEKKKKWWSIQKKSRLWLTRFVETIYLPFLHKTLRWRYISFCTAVSILLLTFGLVKGGLLKFEVFPEVDGFVMTANIEFPNGTPVEVTREATEQVEAALLRLAARTQTRSGEPLLKNRFSLVGQELKDSGNSGPQYGGVQAILLDSESRGIESKDLMVEWEKEVGVISGLKSLTFAGLSHGPPGDPIEIWLQGDDINMLLAARDKLMERLRRFEGVTQIRSDFSPGQNEVRLTLKKEARGLGVTVEDLASQVKAGYFGQEAVRLQRGRDDVRVRVRYSSEERSRFSNLAQIRIRTPEGHEVPLLSVAHASYQPGYDKITRTDGMQRVVVSAGVDTHKANANEIIAELSSNFFGKLRHNNPGLLVAPQGEQKKMRESFSSLIIGYPLAILGMFIIIATMFRSYAQPFIILFTVPFGIIGAFAGHFLMGYDLSMMSMFGMVALTGVVVNDAIVLIERVNNNLAQGMEFFEAIIKGCTRRFRAVFLTTVSTVGGLAPLIMETDLQAKFLIPMALSIAAGVTFATVLTLILIPSLMVILNDLRRLAHRLWRGEWLCREEVEPARGRADVLGMYASGKQVQNVSKPVEGGL